MERLGTPLLDEQLHGKRVLFVTTKNADYIRNVQEIELIQSRAASCKVVASSNRHYLLRIVYVYWLCFVSLFKAPYDVVFVGFSPQLLLPLLPLLRAKHQALVIDFFISVYDTMVFDRQRFSPKGPAARLFHFADRHTLKRADLVITDTQAHQQYFQEEFSDRQQVFETLYLRADRRIYYPRAAAKPAEHQNSYVVLYFGSILPLQGVDVVLKAAALLADAPDIHFVFIGPLQQKHPAKPTSGANVTYIPWLAQEQLAGYIAWSDLCLAGHFNAHIQKAQRTIAGKAYIYQAMEKPMILGDNPANRELFCESETNFFVPMGNPEALADLIRRLAAKQSSPPSN